jgi:hypothetical protein
MAISRIEQLRKVDTNVQSGTDAGQQRRPVELHAESTFERGGNVQLASMPLSLSDDQRGQLQAFREGLTPERREAIDAATDKLVEAIFAEVGANPSGLTSISSGLQATYGQTYEVFMIDSGHLGREDQVTTIMFSAMAGIEAEVADHATMVQERTGLAGETRTDITELRDMLSNWPEGTSQTFTWREVKVDGAGNVTVEEKTAVLTKAEAEALVKNLELQLESIRGQTEIDKFDLQHKYEMMQQAVNTLSNIMKQQHDTEKAIINNVKAS